MINKITLSETALYFGKIKMPKGYEIEKDELVKNITLSQYYEDVKYPFLRTWDKVNTFICDFMRVEYKINLENKDFFGNFYERNETSKPKLHLDFTSLKDSSDLVCLYGVEIDSDSCNLFINYDDNRKKNLQYEIKLKTNEFVMFPSSQSYYINNKNNSYLNYIQGILYNKL